MASTLVGFTANKLILNSSNFRREVVGLERISDVYTARTQDAETLGNIIRNGVSHKTVTSYLSPIPQLSNRYDDMLVENVESENQKGDITSFHVTYVGLFRDLQPKPIITLQPIEDYAFSPFSVTIEFIAPIGDIASTQEINFLKTYRRLNNLPDTINGYTTIKSPVGSFSQSMDSRIAAFVQGSKFFSRALNQYYTSQNANQSVTRNEPVLLREGVDPTKYSTAFSIPNPPLVTYRGFCISGVSYQRYGKFAHAIITASDSARYSYITNTNTLVEEELNWR